MAFGGLGIAPSARDTINMVIKSESKLDGVLFLGDMAFDLRSNDGYNGNEFLKLINPMTELVPFMVIRRTMIHFYIYFISQFQGHMKDLRNIWTSKIDFQLIAFITHMILTTFIFQPLIQK